MEKGAPFELLVKHIDDTVITAETRFAEMVN